MKLLASEQISSNRRFSKQYSRENNKSKTKKLEEKDDFHKMLLDEQKRLNQSKR